MLEKSQEGEDAAKILTLDQINCEVSLEEVVRGFVPTPRFSQVSFDNYQPDPTQPSQIEAVQKLRGYVLQIQEDAKPKSGLSKLIKPPRRKRRGIKPIVDQTGLFPNKVAPQAAGNATQRDSNVAYQPRLRASTWMVVMV